MSLLLIVVFVLFALPRVEIAQRGTPGKNGRLLPAGHHYRACHLFYRRPGRFSPDGRHRLPGLTGPRGIA